MFGVFYLQSEYSLLNNLIPVNKLIEYAKVGNYDFVALSDNNNLYGMYKFFKLAQQNNLKPIIGLKVVVNYEMKKTGFIIYAKDQQGYTNLLNLNHIINLENRELEYHDLIDNKLGLIFISSGNDSLIDQMLSNSQFDDANYIVDKFKNDLELFYLGLNLTSFADEIKVAPQLVNLGIKHQIKIVPLQQTSYLHKQDKPHYDLLRKTDDNNYQTTDQDLSFLTKEELLYRFSDYSFVFKNAQDLVNQITFKFKLPSFDLPSVDTGGIKSDDYLRQQALKGLERRLKTNQSKSYEQYIERLNYELDVIINLNYANYFLIVSDFVRYAKNQDILVGPGRGSGASSLVAYALDITEVDPLKYDLLFERFLNPARSSMPDIDLDFPDDRRDEVIQYVKEKYGQDHIASIITFDTFQFNSSIRDLARANGLSVGQTNVLLNDLKRGTTDFNNPLTKEIIDGANAIINLPRHTGTHPAGIILSTKELSKIIPLQSGPNNFAQTQWDMNVLEEIGLLKIDFLGIKNLTIIDQITKLIQTKDASFDLNKIDFNNLLTYQLLQSGNTNGIFQLEQPGMQNTLRLISPTKFEDLVAILALYRPGPMSNVPIYAERLKGKKYDQVNPILDEILKPTYGIIIYQEQILQIANQFAGYTFAEADLLRRSISKKDLKTLQEEETHFIESSVKHGRDPKLSSEIYDYIVKFADYGFNRAHSVSYAIISYQMAYLKANYFAEFATILLSNNIGNENLTIKYIEELKSSGYKILKPLVNKATNYYQLFNNEVMLPFNLIKGIGRETTRKFLEARENQTFQNYNDFKDKTKHIFGEANLKNLIYAGALDEFKLNKKTMASNLSTDDSKFSAYFEEVVSEISIPEHSNDELVELEKLAYGFNLFYNELGELKLLRDKYQLSALNSIYTQKQLKVIAKVIRVNEITTKSNQKMAFLTIKDDTVSLDVTVFPEVYNKFLEVQDSEVLLFLIEKRKYNQKDSFVVLKLDKIK